MTAKKTEENKEVKKPVETEEKPKTEAKAAEASKAVVSKAEDKATAGGKITQADLIAAIEQMTIVELNDLVKKLEDRFGISAAVPVAAAAVPVAGSATPEAPAEEKTHFTVVLTDGGASKINVIKVVRKYNQALGLKEAKDLVETPPKPVVENVKKEEAEAIKKELIEAGAKVELK